jgi:hypothetical protein
MPPPDVWNEQIVGYMAASKAASWAGGAWDEGQAAYPGGSVAPNLRDRRPSL